jgi:hypothetical protein
VNQADLLYPLFFVKVAEHKVRGKNGELNGWGRDECGLKHLAGERQPGIAQTDTGGRDGDQEFRILKKTTQSRGKK